MKLILKELRMIYNIVFVKIVCSEISFVNGMYTRDGGVHVDNFTGELFKVLCNKLSN